MELVLIKYFFFKKSLTSIENDSVYRTDGLLTTHKPYIDRFDVFAPTAPRPCCQL